MRRSTAVAAAPPSFTDRVGALCESVARSLVGSPLGAEASGLRDRLGGPLRVAIAGRVKAGKSTLLNALVGERLAPTDAGECTRLVTWYADGPGYGVRALGRDGTRRNLRFRRAAGRLEIEVEPEWVDGIERLEVSWPSAALRTATLIDTPGLASLDDGTSRRALDLLAPGDDQPSDADAVIYLMRHLHRSDAEFLGAFMDRSVGHATPVNAIGVLARADEVGAGRLDAPASAARVAARWREDERLRSLVATVVPVAGLVAEAAQTLTEADAAVLRAVADLPPGERLPLLRSVDHFTGIELADVPADPRRLLVARLGLFGVRHAVNELAESRARTAEDLARALLSVSGLEDLRRELAGRFLPRARLLQAGSVLRGLRWVARRLAPSDPGSAHALENDIERLESGGGDLERLRLLHLVLGGFTGLGRSERDEVVRVNGDGSAAERVGASAGARPPDVQSLAAAGVARWRIRAADPAADPVTVEAAEATARSYEAIFADALGGTRS
jgi:hypothetical protein